MYHIDGTEEFGYIGVNRFLYSFYMYMNTVKSLTTRHPYVSVQDLKGYIARYCYLRLQSFDTFIKVVVQHHDFVSAACLLRMLGDGVAVFRLIYNEKDIDLLLLRHALYVIDGCESNLKVFTDININEDILPEKELEEENKKVRRNREYRQQLINEAQEILNLSPLQSKDQLAFNRIVKDKNWKFKDFNDKKSGNNYSWKELYSLINEDHAFNLFSYISQYVHSLSMSNLNIQMDEHNMDGIVGEAVGLLARLHEYTLNIFVEDYQYILQGLLEPDMRNRILACYDEKHRPNVDSWNQEVMNKQYQLQNTGCFDILL